MGTLGASGFGSSSISMTNFLIQCLNSYVLLLFICFNELQNTMTSVISDY